MNNNRGTEAGRALLERNFETIEDMQAYLQEMIAEKDRIKEAQKRRPLQKDDKLFRKTAVIDGTAFLSSVVVRADGSVEFWMKRFLVDEDEVLQCTTHENFELISHLLPHTED